MSITRRRLSLGCVTAVAGAAAVPAWAESLSNSRTGAWPSKTIAILVPFPAGGSADLSARLLAEHLKTTLGQTIVVENKPGAGGNLAAAEAAHAQGDGHTLFVGTNGTQTINQSLYRHLSFDPALDFTGIGMMWSAPHLVAFTPASRRQRWIASSLMHARVRVRSVMARRESVPRPICSARCSRRVPGSTWSTCPIAVRLPRSTI